MAFPSTVNIVRLRLKNPTTSGPKSYIDYHMYPVTNLSMNQSKSSVNISPPGSRPSNNLSMQTSGMKNSITISFAVWRDGEDRSDGTAPDKGPIGSDNKVENLEEQTYYLKQLIHDQKINAKYEIKQTQDVARQISGNRIKTMEGTIDRLRFKNWIGQGASKWLQAEIEFTEGSVI